MTFNAVVKKRLTLPVLKLDIDVTRYVKITGEMHIGKEQKSGRKGATEETKRAPATLCNIVNLEDGAEGQLIVSAVVKSILDDEYPQGAYVGKCFAITKHERVRGKDYFPYDVNEIEDPAKPADLKAGGRGR